MRGRVLAWGFSGAALAAALSAGAAPAAPSPGMAVINCKVADDRSLTDCKLLKESPPGAGFGAAALRMSHLMKLSPQSTTDEGGRITLPILFRPPANEEAAPGGQAAAPAPGEDAEPATPPPSLDLPGVVAA